MYEKTETFLILRYGSIPLAYDAWKQMSYKDQCASFHTPDYEILMEYEYNMQVGGPSPFKPR